MYVCMYLCMYVCMYVCIYVCMYVHTFVCICICRYPHVRVPWFVLACPVNRPRMVGGFIQVWTGTAMHKLNRRKETPKRGRGMVILGSREGCECSGMLDRGLLTLAASTSLECRKCCLRPCWIFANPHKTIKRDGTHTSAMDRIEHLLPCTRRAIHICTHIYTYIRTCEI